MTINPEFQELMRQWSIAIKKNRQFIDFAPAIETPIATPYIAIKEERECIVNKMRENLIKRNTNKNKIEYHITLGNSSQEPINIEKCDVQDLFAVNGDMQYNDI